MEFVKVGKNYMIKCSNGRIVSEKEKLQLENNELVLKDIKGCNCQKETTKKISKNKKRIKELENEQTYVVKTKPIKLKKPTDDIEIEDETDLYEITALEKGESADDIIQETDTII